jgi:hypothetical protein
MKKVLFLLLMCVMAVGAKAQVLTVEEAAAMVTEKGVLEQKRVVVVDSVKKNTLYRRAMEALSDWTGSEGRSKAGIDYSDKEEGAVNYKGVFYQGSKKVITNSIDYYTDFTMKIRCKDGRAQITVIVPSGYAIMTDGSKRSWTMREAIAKTKGKKETKIEGVYNVREVLPLLLDAMESALKKTDDDDF